MKQAIVHIAVVVDDYDAAIKFYTQVLDFILIEDTYVPEQNKRWVLIAPPNSDDCAVLLAQASNVEQKKFVGNQAGGRVFLFLSTDDFWRDYDNYLAKGVKFVRPPAEHEYGTVAVFEDLYGNRWDLIEHKPNHRFSQKSMSKSVRASD